MNPTFFELAHQGPRLPSPTLFQRGQVDLATRIARAAPASGQWRRLVSQADAHTLRIAELLPALTERHCVAEAQARAIYYAGQGEDA